jgi:hypothetical protein
MPLALGGGGDSGGGEEEAPEHAAGRTPHQKGGRSGGGSADEEAGASLMPLEALTTGQLTRELKRRQSLLRQLVSRRDRILRQLKELERQIAEHGGFQEAGPGDSQRGKAPDASRPRRTRARNAVSLPDAIAMAVEVRATITPTEAAPLVLANGYRSTSKNFGMMVAKALAKDARFRRVSRGIYERVS